MKMELGWMLLLAAGAAACGEGGQRSSRAASGDGGGHHATSTSVGGEGAGGGGAGSAACDALPTGAVEPVAVIDVLQGSEDLAFDGKGHIAAKRGSSIVLVDAAEQVANFASLPMTTFGLRYRPDGYLIAARGAGAVSQISPTGAVSVLADGLRFPNGIYADASGDVWVTEFDGDKVVRVDRTGLVEIIASGAPEVSQPNGIVYDASRRALFYTNYSAGEIRRIDRGAPGTRPTVVAVIDGAALDGLVLDACGNLYVIDNGRNRLYRVRLDAEGAPVRDPELLSTFPLSVANAQFGAGPAFDPKTLYVVGNPGTVYAVPVGVSGASIPMPP